MKYYLRYIKNYLRRFFYSSCSNTIGFLLRLFWNPSEKEPEFYLRKFLQKKSNVFFIQVGANDGLINDPLIQLIRMYAWKGILLEPQTFVFETQLVPLHKKSKGIVTINAAIGNNDGKMPLYTFGFSNKRWATGLASFERTTLENKINDGYVERMAKKFRDQLPPEKKDWIQSIPVSILCFETLIDQYNIQSLDLLQIDTEGLDAKIIDWFPFHLLKPTVISFEHENLLASEKKSCYEKLEKQGYQLKILSRDTIAFIE